MGTTRQALPRHAIEDAYILRNRIDYATLDRIARLTVGLKKRMTELLRVETGQRVGDVGCGPGTDTVETAQIVGGAGCAVGIDRDETVLAEAQTRARRADVAAWTHFVAADAAGIPYEADFFDAARSERLFQQVSDPAAVLREMVRVTKPHGQIAVADADWATLSIDTTEVDIERRTVRALPGLVQNGLRRSAGVAALSSLFADRCRGRGLAGCLVRPSYVLGDQFFPA